MKVSFRITDFTRDRRTKAQIASAHAIEQERADQLLEREWRRRVQANITRRRDRRIAKFTEMPLIESGYSAEKLTRG